MTKSPITAFKKLLGTPRKSVLVTHWSPDGDAMGSSLAMAQFLKKLGHKVQVIVPNEYPEFLQWLPGNKGVLNYQVDQVKCDKIIAAAEVIYTLDFNAWSRLEKLGKVLAASPAKKVLIDHHREPENFADYIYHDVAACSTCELVYDLIETTGNKALIDKKMGTCLYTGLMTDTGSFRFPSVTARTHQIITHLMQAGVVPAEIHSAVYDSYSYSRLQLLGFALSQKLKVHPTLPVAWFTFTDSELKQFNYQKGDLEGVVNYPFSIKGIQVCGLFQESEGLVKISFRSKGKIDMNTFARNYFNGGGHVNAAGGRSFDKLVITEKKFLKKVTELFNVELAGK